MNYTAEHIDPEKFEAGLDSHKRYQEELQRTAIEKANAHYEGYCKCLEDVRSMLHCSNYEKQDRLITTSIETGRMNAICEFSKIMEVDCADIVDSSLTFQEKVRRVLERIAWKIQKQTLDEERQNRLYSYKTGINKVLSAIYKEFGIEYSEKDLFGDGEDPAKKAVQVAGAIREKLGVGGGEKGAD